MLRDERDADDYYRSKILSDRVVLSFLDAHPDFWAAMILPGWMHGPGDIGATSAGQTVIDVALQDCPEYRLARSRWSTRVMSREP